MSEIITCPFFGNVDVSHEKNIPFNAKMLEWPIYSTAEKGDRIMPRVEFAYKCLLRSLMGIQGFTFYIGLGTNSEEEELTLFDFSFRIEVYVNEERICPIIISRTEDFCFHFNGVCHFLGQGSEFVDRIEKWSEEYWKNYARNMILTQLHELTVATGKMSEELSNLNSKQLLVIEAIGKM